MVVDGRGRLHEPQGIPTGGQYAASSSGHGVADDLPAPPPAGRDINESFLSIPIRAFQDTRAWVHVERSDGSTVDGEVSAFRMEDGSMVMIAGDGRPVMTGGDDGHNQPAEDVTCLRLTSQLEKYHILDKADQTAGGMSDSTKRLLLRTKDSQVIQEAMDRHDMHADWCLSSNPNLTAEQVTGIIDRYPKHGEERAHMIAGACLNPCAMTDDSLRGVMFEHALRSKEYPAERRSVFAGNLARNPMADDRTLAYLNGVCRSYGVKRAIARNQNAGDSTLAATARFCKDESTKQAVLRNPNCGPETIRAVVDTSVDPMHVREAILHGKCPGDVADRAAMSGDGLLARAAAHNPNLSPAGVDAVLEKAGRRDDVRRAAAPNPRIGAGTLAKWLDEDDSMTDIGIAHNPNATPAMLARLVARHSVRAGKGSLDGRNICSDIACNEIAGMETRRKAARAAGLKWEDVRNGTSEGIANPRRYWAARGFEEWR